MLKNTRHLGIVVKNLDEAIHFFENILNFEIYKRGSEFGKYIDNVVGLNNVHIEWVKLKTPDGFVVELLKYHSLDLPTLKLPQIGCCHIAFTVDNINQTYNLLMNNGYKCNSLPQLSSDKKAKFMYCNGPEGITLELVEEL